MFSLGECAWKLKGGEERGRKEKKEKGTHPIPNEDLCILHDGHINSHNNIRLFPIKPHIKTTLQIIPPVLLQRMLE